MSAPGPARRAEVTRADYETPPEVFDALNAECGFTLDAAAPSCPDCGGPMRWTEPPDARTTRWWCVAFPRCFGRREPESQKELRL